MIIETIHVDFNELTAMASEQFSSGPGPNLMTPGTISSEYSFFNFVFPAPEHVISTGTPSSTTVDQDAPSMSTSQTTQETPYPIIPLGVDEAAHDIEVAHLDNNPFVEFSVPEPSSEESSTWISQLNPLYALNISMNLILKMKTSLSECNQEEQNVLYFNDLFPLNVIYLDDSKPDKDNDDDKIDIKQSSGRLDALPPTLFEGYDRDLRELYTRSGAVRDEIFSQRYMFRRLEREQERATVTFSAIWRPVFALEAWRENHDLRMQLSEERRERLDLADRVARMERRHKSREE
ncbi:hypothetical protein Tco_0282949 [Tanacetum coccineum]